MTKLFLLFFIIILSFAVVTHFSYVYALTYQNNIYNFLVKYPDDWVHEEPRQIPLGDGTIVWLYQEDNRPTPLNVRVGKGYTPEDYKLFCTSRIPYLTEVVRSPSSPTSCSNFIEETKILTIHGVNATYHRYSMTYHYPQNETDKIVIQVNFPTKKGEFNIVTGMNLETYILNVKTLDSIIESFRIIDPQIQLLSPKKQLDNGTAPQDIVCRDGLVLIKKISKDTVACVKPSTAEKLVQRGWGVTDKTNKTTQIQMIMVANSNFTISYNIQEGQLNVAYYSSGSKSLILSLNATNNNELTVTIPRALIDTVMVGGQDDRFIVLTDGYDTEYTEHDSTSTYRTLTIPIKQGVHEIEIVATFLP